MNAMSDWRRLRAERRLWTGARTLDDLGELTARWLDRSIAEHPGYPGKEGPDPETMPIAKELAAINRAGLVTTSSQPGVVDGPYRQRAAVECLTDLDTAAHLQAVGYPGLQVIVHITDTPRRRTGYGAVVPVTVHGDQVWTRFGVHLSRRDIAGIFERTAGPALEAAFEATQVTLIDLDWGQNTLWSWLVTTLTENNAYTHPDVLTIGVDEGWADPETDPTRIDWAPRQAAAAIPFAVVDGRPVNPAGPTGIRYGRNQLGHWGEALAADALVLATTPAGERYALMVERTDNDPDGDNVWAIPGGHVEPGEPAQAAAVRELEEETGLRTYASWRDWHQSPPRYVPDPRASDEAWMVTVLCVLDLGTVEELPPVEGYDDAARADWIRAGSYEALTADLAETYQGSVFAAHVEMLQATLDGIQR